jgi:hypothetical protein
MSRRFLNHVQRPWSGAGKFNLSYTARVLCFRYTDQLLPAFKLYNGNYLFVKQLFKNFKMLFNPAPHIGERVCFNTSYCFLP